MLTSKPRGKSADLRRAQTANLRLCAVRQKPKLAKRRKFRARIKTKPKRFSLLKLAKFATTRFYRVLRDKLRDKS